MDEHGRITPYHYMAERQITIGKHEMVSFSFKIVARQYCDEYVIDFITSDGYRLTVSDSGRPWRISGPAAKYSVDVSYDVMAGRFVLHSA